MALLTVNPSSDANRLPQLASTTGRAPGRSGPSSLPVLRSGAERAKRSQRRSADRYQRVRARRQGRQANWADLSIHDSRIRTYLEHANLHVVDYDWHEVDMLV